MFQAKKRKPTRSGIQHHAQREWPKHDRWIRGLECVATQKDPGGCSGKVRACHHRTAANSGTGLKPPSWDLWPGCDGHHGLQHQKGQPWFEKWLGLKLDQVAKDLAKQSPDTEMKAVMRAEGLL